MAGQDAEAQIGRTGSDEQEVHATDEQSPLLGNANGPVSQGIDDSQEEETTVIAKEVPFKLLAVMMGTAWIGVFFGAIDSTVIATLSGPISSEFKSLSLLSWVATAYLISNAACQPISGRLTDIFGRGPGLVFSNIFFSAGNLMCGLANNESSLILGRVIAGIGGGGLMSISTFLGSDLVPLRKRGIVQGIGNVCYGTGATLGGVLGGLINDNTKMGWRLAFLVQVPPTILSGIIAYFLIRVPPKVSNKSYLARIDFPGVFLTVSFLVLLLLGLNSGGNNVPWTHPLPLTTIPLSAVLFITFLWWESRARQPIIPVKLLATRTVFWACMCNFFSTMLVFSGLFYVPLYFQVRGRTPTAAGLFILPSPIGSAVGSISSGYLMNRTGKYTKLGIFSACLVVSGVALFCVQDESSPPYLCGLAFLVIGAGYGAILTITMLACVASVEHAHQAVVTSTTYLARSLGSSIGITISSAVYQNMLLGRLWERFGDYPNAAEQIQRIRDNLSELKHLPEGWYEGVISSYMESFRAVFLAMLGYAVLSLICISLIRQHALHATMERTGEERR